MSNGQNVDRNNVEQTKCRTDKMYNRQNVDRHNVDRQNVDKHNVNRQNVDKQTECRLDKMHVTPRMQNTEETLQCNPKL